MKRTRRKKLCEEFSCKSAKKEGEFISGHAAPSNTQQDRSVLLKQ
jgi:hypothetical protein